MKSLYLVMLLTIFAMAGCGQAHVPARLRISATKADLASFRTALAMFRADNGRYPTTAEGLDGLLHRPQNLPNWKQYLDCDRIPFDPWSHPYVYRCPGVYNPNTCDLYSCGPDGITGSGGNDPDDINSWNPSSPISTWNEAEEFSGLPELAAFGGVVFLAVMAMEVRNKRASASDGNLNGVFAVLWVAAAPALLLLFVKTVGTRVDGYPGFIAFIGWAIVLLLLSISGLRRGSPFSKTCAFYLLMVIAIGLLICKLFLPKVA